MWQSADGRRGLAGTQRNVPDGTWSRLGGVESLCEAVQDHPGQQVCYPGYLTELPGTVSGMLAYLLRDDGPNGPAAYRVLGSIVNTSSASGLLVPSASYALMYRAAATVKGIYLVPHVTDIAGRAGIGVAACVPTSIGKGSMPGFRGCPERTELIFDADDLPAHRRGQRSRPGETGGARTAKLRAIAHRRGQQDRPASLSAPTVAGQRASAGPPRAGAPAIKDLFSPGRRGRTGTSASSAAVQLSQ